MRVTESALNVKVFACEVRTEEHLNPAYKNALFHIFALIFKGGTFQCHIFLFMLNLKSKFVFDNMIFNTGINCFKLKHFTNLFLNYILNASRALDL